MKTRMLIFQAVLLAASISDVLAAAPSFDCKANGLTPIEQSICDNSWLSSLDAYYAELHAYLLGEVVDRNAFILDQREWLKERNGCEIKSCLSDIYVSRFNSQFSKYERVLNKDWLRPIKFLDRIKSETIRYNKKLLEDSGSFDIESNSVGRAQYLSSGDGNFDGLFSSVPKYIRNRKLKIEVGVPGHGTKIGVQHNILDIEKSESDPNKQYVPDVGKKIENFEPVEIHRLDPNRYVFKYSLTVSEGISKKTYLVEALVDKYMRLVSVAHDAGDDVQQYAKIKKKEIDDFKPGTPYAEVNTLYSTLHDIYRSGYRAPVVAFLQKIFLYDPIEAVTVNDSLLCDAINKKFILILADKKSGGINVECAFGSEMFLGSNNKDKINGGHGADVLVGLKGNDLLDASSGDAVFWGGWGDDVYDISHGNGIILLGNKWGDDVFKGDGIKWIIFSKDIDMEKLEWVSEQKLVYKDSEASISFVNDAAAYRNVGILFSNIEID